MFQERRHGERWGADVNKGITFRFVEVPMTTPPKQLLLECVSSDTVPPRPLYFSQDCNPEKRWESTDRKDSDWIQKSHDPIHWRMFRSGEPLYFNVSPFHVYIKHIFDLAYSWYKYVISQLAYVRWTYTGSRVTQRAGVWAAWVVPWKHFLYTSAIYSIHISTVHMYTVHIYTVHVYILYMCILYIYRKCSNTGLSAESNKGRSLIEAGLLLEPTF